MRSIAADSLRELFGQETAYVWLPAVSIRAGDLSLHLVANTEPITITEAALTTVYTPCPFELTLPDEDEETTPQVTLVMDAVGPAGRGLIKALQSITPSNVTLILLRGKPVDTGWEWYKELTQDNWNLLNATVTDRSISLTLGYRMNLLNEPATVGRFIPAVAPGLFR